MHNVSALNTRVPTPLFEALVQRAEENRRTIQAEVILALEAHLDLRVPVPSPSRRPA